MPSYLHPGVYIEEVPSSSRPIATASTSIPIFAGLTDRGPIGKPKFILKWGDYVNTFGGIQSEFDYMGLSIASYFMNGGGPAYIARLRDGAVASVATLRVDQADAASATLIALEAASKGLWADDLFIIISNSDPAGLAFDLTVYLKEGTEYNEVESFARLGMNSNKPNFIGHVLANNSKYLTGEYKTPLKNDTSTLNSGATAVGSVTSGVLPGPTDAEIKEHEFLISVDGGAQETVNITIDSAAISDVFDDLTTALASLDVAVAMVGADKISITSDNHGPTASVVVSGDLASQLLLTAPNAEFKYGEEAYIPGNHAAPITPSTGLNLSGGGDGNTPTAAEFGVLFDGPMMELPKISIVVLPGQDPSKLPDKSILDAGIAHCEKITTRMIIVDPPSGTDPTTFTSPYAPSTYAVLYYPWISVPNSLFDADKNPSAPPSVLIPPSGAAAGMWAKTDGKRGVWKAPAGVATGLLGISGTEFEIPDAVQNFLNPRGINCIRNIPRFNYVFWGARTLATDSAPEWRYVPIRRTAIMIERSIYDGIQWAVFEPNDHKLWASLRLNIGNFMDGLFRAGAFQGEKASDAYFVNCGLDDTMTQADIDNGQVIVEVGFAPLKPAEFVIVRIQQIVGQAR